MADLGVFVATGRLGKDAETKSLTGGTKVTNFSLAVSQYRGKEKEEETLWLDCAAFGDRWENLTQYLTKGTRIAVRGEISLRQWENDNGHGAAINLNVQDVTLLGSNPNNEGGTSTTKKTTTKSGSSKPKAKAEDFEDFADDPDDAPF